MRRWYCPDHKEDERRWIKRAVKEGKAEDRAIAKAIKKEAAKVNAIKGKVCMICGINLISAQDKRVWDAQMAKGLLTNRLDSSLRSDEENVLDRVESTFRMLRFTKMVN